MNSSDQNPLNFDIEAYLSSGTLELYASGSLNDADKAEAERVISIYPEIRAELDKIELALEQYAASTGMMPSPHMREKIESTIDQLNKEREMELDDLLLINRFSDAGNWLRVVNDFIPEQLDGERFGKILQKTSTLTQMLLVSTADFEDEVHTDVHESFLILRGECQCTVGDHVFKMKIGDYTEIPLHQLHKVEILSGPIVAILQRIAV